MALGHRAAQMGMENARPGALPDWQAVGEYTFVKLLEEWSWTTELAACECFSHLLHATTEKLAPVPDSLLIDAQRKFEDHLSLESACVEQLHKPELQAGLHWKSCCECATAVEHK